MTHLDATRHLLLAVREESGIVWGRFDHSRPGVGNAEWTVMIGAASLLVIVAIISLWRSRRRRAEFITDSSPTLFNELCRAHRFSRSNQRAMKKLAAARGLQSAAELFVEPEHFEIATLSPTLKDSADELCQLRREMFE